MPLKAIHIQVQTVKEKLAKGSTREKKIIHKKKGVHVIHWYTL